MRLRSVYVALVFTALAGCESSPRSSAPTTPEDSREMATTLTPQLRAQLARDFDIVALDELLPTLNADEAHMALQALSSHAGKTAFATGGAEQTHLLLGLGDQRRDALWNRVWAPFWDRFPDAELEPGFHIFPGRDLARTRRIQQKTQRKPGRP